MLCNLSSRQILVREASKQTKDHNTKSHILSFMRNRMKKKTYI